MRSGVSGSGSVVIGDEVAEVAVLFLTDRGLQRDRLLSDAHDLAHRIDRHIQLFRDLVGGRLVTVLVEKLRRDFFDLIDGLDHMDGDTDGTRLIRDRTGDRLSDPPCCVGGELEALGIVELLDSLDQAEVTLLNQIEEVHTAAEISLSDTDDQSEVGFGQALLCGNVTLRYTDRKLDLFRGEQRYTADLFEIDLDGVVDRDILGGI